MTTIAYKGGIIAYDSVMTDGQIIVDGEFNKRVSSNGVDFFYTGVTGDIEDFINTYMSGNFSSERNLGITVMVRDQGALYHTSYDYDEKRIWRMPMKKDTHYAIGSGQHFALAAMDLGMTAKEAVAYAAKRDLFTGGPINTFEVWSEQEEKKAA